MHKKVTSTAVDTLCIFLKTFSEQIKIKGSLIEKLRDYEVPYNSVIPQILRENSIAKLSNGTWIWTSKVEPNREMAKAIFLACRKKTTKKKTEIETNKQFNDLTIPRDNHFKLIAFYDPKTGKYHSAKREIEKLSEKANTLQKEIQLRSKEWDMIISKINAIKSITS